MRQGAENVCSSPGAHQRVQPIIGNLQATVDLIRLVWDLLRNPLVGSDQARGGSSGGNEPYQISFLGAGRPGPEVFLVLGNMANKGPTQLILRIRSRRQIVASRLFAALLPQ